MPLDRTVLGNLAAEQMAALDEIYGEDEEAEIAAVITIVEVIKQEGAGRVSTTVRTRSNVPDPYRRVGLLEQAAQHILASDEA
jgi:beta-phosphoglucomutase-like phosphatase (HAD superfamily)